MRKLILGTAGHIDHGKTTLVRALTGVDTDRLAEEKRRGITIDLGFARLALGDDIELGIVDVPGHEAFVRNMLAGATGIDLVMLVIAADEGVMPQTREHLAIVELLGVRSGVVALTKTDLVDAEWLDLVVEDVRGALASTSFADSPIIPVSSTTGEGLDVLKVALGKAATIVAERSADDHFRLAVDRVFTVRGTGTVVTGTVWSGRLGRDENVRILPTGKVARVRGIQAYGNDADEARAGQRAAIALAGIDRGEVERGAVLVTGPAWSESRMVTVRVELLESSEWMLRMRQRVRFHLGTAEVMGRVVLFGTSEIGPGEGAWAQMRLEEPVVARAGDRFVLRSYSPVATIGGGVVVEPVPVKRKRLGEEERERLEAVLRGDPEEAVRARVAEAGWSGVDVSSLSIETPNAPRVVDATVGRTEGQALLRLGDRLFDAALGDRARTLFVEAVDAFHAAYPLHPGLDREELRRSLPPRAHPAVGEWALDGLLGEGVLEARGSVVARAGYEPRLTDAQHEARERLRMLIEEGGLAPPAIGELPEDLRDHPDLRGLLRLLEDEGAIVPIAGGEFYFSRAALDQAANAIREGLRGSEGLGPADFRSVLPVSRKFLIPLLEHFDQTGVTVRRPEGRAVPATT